MEYYYDRSAYIFLYLEHELVLFLYTVVVHII